MRKKHGDHIAKNVTVSVVDNTPTPSPVYRYPKSSEKMKMPRSNFSYEIGKV